MIFKLILLFSEPLMFAFPSQASFLGPHLPSPNACQTGSTSAREETPPQSWGLLKFLLSLRAVTTSVHICSISAQKDDVGPLPLS